MIRFIGDIHGQYLAYVSIVDDCKYPTVQIGDFGLGFAGRDVVDDFATDYLKNNSQHRFIRGNHDNPKVCKQTIGYIEDGTVENDIMYVGGAWSIDYALRTEGVSWWADEELSSVELHKILDIYQTARPRIMVTHDAPYSITKQYFVDANRTMHKELIKTRTNQFFDIALEIHKPEIWIFGHWHLPLDVMHKDTRFICLPELGYIDIE